MKNLTISICLSLSVFQTAFCQTMNIHTGGGTEHYALADIDSITFTAESSISFPVDPELFLNHSFNVCEGISFNGEENLFVSGNQTLWSVSVTGELTSIATGYSNLGLAPSGERDILFADFGPTNAFAHGPNSDGIVWLVTPEGTQTVAASNMGDPNFVLKLENGSFLVSDDATDEIFIINTSGETNIFTQSVNHPNGMVLSLDGETLYIAQMFQAIHPNWVFDGSIWAIGIEDGEAIGDPVEIIDLGDNAGIDGLAQDIFGRLYIACWNRGQIWRFDPESSELVLICENVPGVASLAFGRGSYDTTAIYATSTLEGSVWKIQVGVQGALLHQ
jgi:SMP-30/Gluconolactonase/LRE-like region